MTQKAALTSGPWGSTRWVMVAHLCWLVVLLVIGSWWGWLVLKQAELIYDLEQKQGLSPVDALDHWQRTRRMVLGEGSFFFALLLLSAIAISWFYFRDHRRQRSIQAFFAGVTHELRTPLTSIRLQAESIGDAIERRLEVKESSELIRRLLEDTLRLESQVERTLELARVEGGGPVLSQTIELRSWLGRFLERWSETYSARLSFQVDVPEVSVEADPTALQVIFRNMIENSVRHSGRERVEISIGVQDQLNEVRVSFSDNGLQKDAGLRKFGELFAKGPGSSGAGVGLYLVRVLMERMGGTARFSAEPSGFQTQLTFRRGHQHG